MFICSYFIPTHKFNKPEMAYQLLSNSNFIGWKSINTSVHVIIQTTHPQDIMTQNCIHVHTL